jgi:hypothetical protein
MAAPKHRRNTMSTLKRWQTPASLSLVLVAAIILVLAVGYRAHTQSAGRATLASTTAASAPAQCSGPQLAAATASAPPVAPAATPAFPSNNSITAPAGGGSGNDILSVVGSNNQTQGNDGGFGDIGMQFQNVNINAPITNIHVSGTNNSTNVNVAADNTVTVDPPTTSGAATTTAPPTTSTDPSTPSTSTPPSTATPPSTSTPPSTPTPPSTSTTPSSSTPSSSSGTATTPSASAAPTTSTTTP